MTTLRDYQHRAIDAMRTAFVGGKRAVCGVSPTGSGKTITGAAIVASHVARGGKVNWFAHRRELLAQAANTLRGFGVDVGHAGLGQSAPVQVVSVQTALARGEVRASTLDVVDECHHFAADDWGRLLSSHPRLIVGLTATPERGDGRALSGFDHMIVVAQVPELIAAGHLVPVDVHGPKAVQGSGKIAMLPVDAYARFGGGKRNIVFAPHVKAAEEFAEQFRARRIACAVVHGKMSADERDDALDRFATGEIRVLVNCHVLTEGFDCPATEIVTIARSVGSAGMFLQMCGRGMRPSPGKNTCTILDLSGACILHGRPDELREFSLDGIGIARAGVTGPRVCSLCKRELGVDEVVCGICGREVPELVTPEATGAAMVKYAVYQRDAADVRIQRLAKFYDVARLKYTHRQSIGIASAKFNAMYKQRPTAEVIHMAMTMAKGMR